MKSRQRSETVRPARWDKLDSNPIHDNYRPTAKFHEPTACEVCGAVYVNGRWSWAAVPDDADRVTCPACRRIHDQMPAGQVELSGTFLHEHQEEIMALIRHHEAKMKSEHPMERIMAVTTREDGVTVTTTGSHLARDIGEALKRAFQGHMEMGSATAESMLRVIWSR